MCAKFGCGPTVVSKKRGGVQTDKHTKKTAALYSSIIIITLVNDLNAITTYAILVMSGSNCNLPVGLYIELVSGCCYW